MDVAFKSDTCQTAKLYPDYGKGFDEKKAYNLPHRHTKPSYKVVYFEKRPKTLRFDPVEEKIDFQITEFKIFRLNNRKAEKYIFKRIANLHPQYNQLSERETHDKIKSQYHGAEGWLDYIYSIYEETFSCSHSEISYQSWLKNQEIKKYAQVQTLLKETKPTHLISILLPTYNSNPKYLQDCIESVLRQSYQKWQLCIVDDASNKDEHLNLIRSYAEQDHRIVFHKKSENTHISATTNACLKMAKGDYVLLLDHDDMLASHALLMMVNQLQLNPDLKLIYADEDKIDIHNARYEPHFKPEWNPDLMYSQNYIGHPVLLEISLLRSIDGLRVGFEGSQDHDLLLRYTSKLNTAEIHRIPQVLYHWRAHDESTASGYSAKDYTTDAGIKALRDFFDNQSLSVSVCQAKYPNTYKLTWPIPKNQPLVSLIVPTHNGYEILKNCIESILEKTSYNNYEILIINNRTSCNKTLEFINRTAANNIHANVLTWDHPFNYSAINNFAVSHARGDVIGLINNDIEVISPDWLTEMVSHAIRPDIGCVGAKLYYSDDTIQHAGVIMGIGGVAGHSHKHFTKESHGYFSRLHLVQNLSAVTAACLVVEKDIYTAVNGLDDINLPVAFNDVDLCIRVSQAGYRNLWTPFAELYHHESISRGKEDTQEKQIRAQSEIEYMIKTWGIILNNDPAYNPNLTLQFENFSIQNA